ncbi:MAG: S8 family peptidase [Acetatifactor sp.]|nr:S8 family peptidase [Acetatifactor sp.]
MQRVRKQIDFFSEYGMADGAGITIAVLDSGICGHPDLEGKTLEFRDFVENHGTLYDDNGHGTHVCGILCGSGGLSGGRYRGMAPGARLVVGKVLDKDGDGSTEAMLSGLDWILEARMRYRIRILNISVGIGNLKEKAKELALQEKVEKVWDSGILVVCAAGNKGPGNGTISAVGGSGKVITVGCHDGAYRRGDSGLCAAYSGRGDRNSSPRKPDIVAPGTDIMSCNVNYHKKSAYIAKSGTSMATPIVSGAAALVFQRYPHMSNEECRQKLLFTATDLHLPWNQQGWGMVNVSRLLSG